MAKKGPNRQHLILGEVIWVMKEESSASVLPDMIPRLVFQKVQIFLISSLIDTPIQLERDVRRVSWSLFRRSPGLEPHHDRFWRLRGLVLLLVWLVFSRSPRETGFRIGSPPAWSVDAWLWIRR